MQELIRSGKRYLKGMDLTDLAALKICLISMGALIGLFVPSKSKKSFGILMGILFVSTYIPLMGNLFLALKEDE